MWVQDFYENIELMTMAIRMQGADIDLTCVHLHRNAHDRRERYVQNAGHREDWV